MKKIFSHFLKMHPIVFLVFLLMTFSSCSRYYYSPDDNNMQSINEKGDIHLSASSSIGGFRRGSRTRHYNFQLGGSPIQHLSLAGSFFYLKDTIRNGNGFTISDDDFGTGEGHIWNGAIGTYYFFPKSESLDTRRSRIRRIRGENQMEAGHFFDFYIGHASGISKNYHDGWRVSDISTLKFNKTYGQVGWHWRNENFGFSYTFKLSQLNFYSAKSFGRVDDMAIEKLAELETQNKFYIRENSLRIHYGAKYVRFFYNWTFLLAPPNLQNLGVDNSNFQLGVFLEIDELIRKKRKKRKKQID